MTQHPERPLETPMTADTKRTASRHLLLWIVPLAVVALAILFLGIHYTGGTK